LIRLGGLPKSVAGYWRESIVNCYEALEAYLNWWSSRSDRSYVASFEWLYEEAKKAR
jgi:hypothetical protein